WIEPSTIVFGPDRWAGFQQIFGRHGAGENHGDESGTDKQAWRHRKRPPHWRAEQEPNTSPANTREILLELTLPLPVKRERELVAANNFAEKGKPIDAIRFPLMILDVTAWACWSCAYFRTVLNVCMFLP